MKDKWVEVGKVPVDSGSVVICDPGSLHNLFANLENMSRDQRWASWDRWNDDERIKKFLESSGAPIMLKVNRGEVPSILIGTAGHGDGLYPVDARFENGRLAALRIRFT